MPKYQNIYRYFHKFPYAVKYLADDESNGPIISRLDGEFNCVCDTYSSDVTLQYRIPAKVDFIHDKFVKTATITRSLVDEGDVDTTTEVALESTGNTDEYKLVIHEAPGETHALDDNHLEEIPIGTTISLTQSTNVWSGIVRSIEHTSDNEADIILLIPTSRRTGTLSEGSDVTIKIGIQEDTGSWKDVKYEGTVVTFDSVGETKIINLSAQFDYRFNTATAGSVMYIAPIWQNTSSD